MIRKRTTRIRPTSSTMRSITDKDAAIAKEIARAKGVATAKDMIEIGTEVIKTIEDLTTSSDAMFHVSAEATFSSDSKKAKDAARKVTDRKEKATTNDASSTKTLIAEMRHTEATRPCRPFMNMKNQTNRQQQQMMYP
eukprot:9485288-Pyramimonas_sp.AAC.1